MHQNYIDGRFVPAAGAEKIEVRNPARGTVISDIPDSPREAVEIAIAAARKAQPGWEKRPANERASYLRKVGAKIRAHAEEIARVITEEQGKLLDLARVEANFTADYLDYMAEWARRIEGEILPSDRANETIFVIQDLDEAIAKANDSDYGLTSSIYTRDLKTAIRASNGLKFGETYINRENFEAMQGFHAGVRRSGIGGADGKHGLLEYTQTQMVYLQS